MSVMDNFIKAFKLSDEDDSDFLDGDEFEENDIPPKKGSAYDNESAGDSAPSQPDQAARKPVSRFSQSRSSAKGRSDGPEVCVIKPTAFDECREITDTLLANRAVVLNLEGLDVVLAQRIVDYTSGSCYAMRGKLQKISHYIFIITPPSMNISGDFQDLVNSAIDSPFVSGIMGR
ncbi:MAG: cell division protein SepF [Lachnospiraceae bacterium]|nr:cell division protein SepF [Lachnospiraceae bacterium]